MRHILRCLRTLLTGLVLLFGLALAGVVFLLPSYVEQELLGLLEEVGFRQAALEVRSISWSGLQIARIRLDPEGRFRAGAVDIAFTLDSLRRREVRTVEITGASWEVRLGEGGLDLSPFQGLDRETRAGRTGRLPFEELRLRSSLLLLRRGEESWHIPLEGTLVNLGEGRVRAELQLVVQEIPLRVKGEILLAGASPSGEVEVEGAAPLVRQLVEGQREKPPGEETLGLRLRILPEGEQSVLEVALGGRWPRLALGSGAEAMVAEGIGLDGEMVFDLASRQGTFRGGLNAAVVHLGQGPADEGAGFLGAVLTLNLELTASERGWFLRCQEGTDLQASELVLGTPERGARGGPLRLTLEDGDPQGLLFPTAGRPGREGLALAALLRSRDPLLLRAPDLEAELAAMEMSAQISWPERGERRVSAHLGLRLPRLVRPEAGLSFSGLELDLPLASDEEGSRPGRQGGFSTAEVAWRGHRFLGPAGTLVREPGGWSWAGRWNDAEGLELDLRGQVRFAEGRPELEVEMQAPPFAFRSQSRLGRLLAELTGIELEGMLSLGGRLIWSHGHLDPSCRLALSEGRLQHRDLGLILEGLRADLVFTGFAPLATAPGQAVGWQEGRVGDLEMNEGEVVFGVERPEQVLVERTVWRLGPRGRFWTQAFRFDPARPDLDLTIFAEQVSLQEWLSLATVDHATGEGTLNGRLSLRIRTQPRLKITLGEGFLNAAGEGGFRIEDAELVREMLARHAPRTGEGEEIDYNQLVQERIVQSLSDFEYSFLRFDLIPKDGELTLRVHTKGRGRDVPQELDLTVNFNGFQQLISLVLGVRLGLEEAERETLERLRGRH